MKNQSLENTLVRRVSHMLGRSSPFHGTNHSPGKCFTVYANTLQLGSSSQPVERYQGSVCGWNHTAVSAAILILFANWCIFPYLFSGSLCDGTTSQCYLLPVLDTIFVQRKYRRGGLGMKMLHDFCQSFLAEDALGISCPISAAMYQGKPFDVDTLGKGHV